jgi:hypothetical protein
VKPVFQDRFGWGEGSCAWACIASIFELPLAQFERCRPPNDSDIQKWTECALPHLMVASRDVATNYRMIYSPYVGLKWTYDVAGVCEPPTDDYWIATVHSNAVKSPPESDWWPMPGLHAVVMHGSEFVHDPNPKYQGMPLPPMVSQLWWLPRNDESPRTGSDRS